MAINLMVIRVFPTQLHTVWLQVTLSPSESFYNKVLEKERKTGMRKTRRVLRVHFFLSYEGRCTMNSWGTAMGNRNMPHSHSHTWRQRLALLPTVCAKRSRIHQQTAGDWGILDDPAIWIFFLNRHFTNCHVPATESHSLSCSLSPFLSVIISVQRGWVLAAPGPELWLLGDASSSKAIWQGSAFFSFLILS